MFTGIIEEKGRIEAIKQGAKSAVLTIRAEHILDDVRIGDSVAVNGVCLTATTVGSNYFTADVMAETLRRSSLGRKPSQRAPAFVHRAALELHCRNSDNRVAQSARIQRL